MNDPQNPYGPPQSQVRAERIAQLVTASRAQRLVNLLIDSAAATALLFCGLTVYSMFEPEAFKLLQPDPNAAWNPKLQVLLLAAQFAYYVPMEGIFGVTLGKLVTNTRVVAEDGRPPSWGQVLGRTAVRQVPLEAITILFTSAERAAAWHDRLPKTLVVRGR